MRERNKESVENYLWKQVISVAPYSIDVIEFADFEYAMFVQ